jgi:heme a synthase
MDNFSRRSDNAVAAWIFTGVVMLMIQVVLGGVTRLTGSGLSITEWNIVTGTLPPLNDAAWLGEFQKYQRTPQYQLINADFTLSDFKFIFFWEWLHRLWARLIAVAFVIPFVYFLVKRSFKKEMIIPLIILFLLGALQGAVGWIMVASGLVGDAIYVRPTRLALHFIFALALIAYAFWFGLKLAVPQHQLSRNKVLYRWALGILVILAIQFLFGALMAGHKAATAAPTFPDINGDFIPEQMARYKPLLMNMIENKITIHFMHRMLAYLLFVMTVAWTVHALKTKQLSNYLQRTRWVPLLFVLTQLILGVITVVTSPSIVVNEWGLFHWMAELHQVTGMLFMLAMVWVVFLTKRWKSYI